MTGDVVLTVDGAQPPSGELVDTVQTACDRAEEIAGHGRLILHVSAAPAGPWSSEVTVALVSKWERALRRLERLPVFTISIADGDCGGLALDALLATDYRIATRTVRLLTGTQAEPAWPGMALYRLAHQGARAAAIRRAVLVGTPIPVADALALNLIDTVVEDERSALDAAALYQAPPAGFELAIRRQLLLEAPAVEFEEALGAHLAACDRALRGARDATGTAS